MIPMARLLFMIAILLTPSPLDAGDKPAAKLRSPIGTLLQRGGDKGWLTPMLYDAIPAGVTLVALPGARGLLDVQEGDVRLVRAGNVPFQHATGHGGTGAPQKGPRLGQTRRKSTGKGQDAPGCRGKAAPRHRGRRRGGSPCQGSEKQGFHVAHSGDL